MPLELRDAWAKLNQASIFGFVSTSGLTKSPTLFCPSCVHVRASRRAGTLPFCFLARLITRADAYGDVADKRLEVVIFAVPLAFYIHDSAREDERSSVYCVQRSTSRSPV